MKHLCRLVLPLLAVLMLGSCATFNGAKPRGVARIKHYDFYSEDLPQAFDGLDIAFITDLHYKSLFGRRKLVKLTNTLNRMNADVLLMGGDYKEGCENIEELFAWLGRVKTAYGTYAVFGNNDYETCADETRQAMAKNGIRLLEHKVDSLVSGKDRIFVCGVGNPFDMEGWGPLPLEGITEDDFLIMLVHTPDYAENADTTLVDVAFAGHTHAGQVTLFGLYAPVIPSQYGQRFRRGLKYTDSGTPVFISNGIGTSQRNIRLFAPSEIMVVTLHCGR